MMEEGTFLNQCRMPCGMEIMSVLCQAGAGERLVRKLTLDYNLMILNRGSAWLYETVHPKHETLQDGTELDPLVRVMDLAPAKRLPNA